MNTRALIAAMIREAKALEDKFGKDPVAYDREERAAISLRHAATNLVVLQQHRERERANAGQ